MTWSKPCTKCKEIKTLDQFHNNPRSKDGKQYQCSICRLKIEKLWRDRNRESRKEYYKRYEATKRIRPETYTPYKRSRRIEKLYNLTENQINNMLISQNYSCKICKINIISGYVIDHCHFTKLVRGILCNKCNLLLGHAKDSTEILDNAVTYLRSTK